MAQTIRRYPTDCPRCLGECQSVEQATRTICHCECHETPCWGDFHTFDGDSEHCQCGARKRNPRFYEIRAVLEFIIEDAYKGKVM